MERETTDPLPKSEGHSDHFQILSLDGGGFKGLFSAAVLAKLEEKSGHRITDHFDLITGTSTGGLIAIGLGLGLSPREIVQFYVKDGPTIFGNRFGWRWCLQWTWRKFPQSRLKTALQSESHLYGDNSLCLHLSNEWAPTMLLADTIVPWSSEWLFHYEIWLSTGEWQGGGLHPGEQVKLERRAHRNKHRRLNGQASYT